MRELEPGHDVADGPDAVDTGAAVVVGGDEATVESDALLLVAEVLGARHPADSNEEYVGPQLGGRSIAVVARSLEMSGKSLANWVYRARKGQALVKRAPALPTSELQAEVSRLRQENAKLKVEKEILKKAAAYFAKESM